MKTNDLIAEVASLPVEERARVAESILRTLNPPQPEIDREWAELAGRRLDELRAGRTQAVPGSEVVARLQKRFRP